MDREASPALPVSMTILVLGPKLLNPDEILVAILFLSLLLDRVCGNTVQLCFHYLCILTRNLNLVNLTVLKLREIMTESVKRLNSGS